MLQAAQAAAGAQVYPPATLYVVATPIGNLADLSLRALHTLQLVDAVACEDTRHTSALMRHFGLDKPLIKAHEHNEREAAEAILQRLKLGERVAYVSDAGTPGVSDPGVLLATRVLAAGRRVLPVPGCSSVVAAPQPRVSRNRRPPKVVKFTACPLLPVAHNPAHRPANGAADGHASPDRAPALVRQLQQRLHVAG